MDSDDRIVLDQKAFAVLASDTRVKILKSLDGTQKTVTDLARELEMNKATMFQHLERLQEAGLVKRKDGLERLSTVKPTVNEPEQFGPPRKWVYYKLTWRGQTILHPERVRISLMLGTVAAVGVAILLLLTLSVLTPPPDAGTVDTVSPTMTVQQDVAVDSNSPSFTMTILATDPRIDSLGLSSPPSGVDPDSVRVAIGFVDDPFNATMDVRGRRTLDGAAGEVTITSLAQGQDHVRFTINGTVDLTNAGGTFLYVEVTLTDMKGNVASHALVDYVEPPSGPDLSLLREDFPSRPAGFKTIRFDVAAQTLTVNVTNAGDRPTDGGEVVALYLLNPDSDFDGVADGELQTVGKAFIPSLAPGQTFERTWEWDDLATAAMANRDAVERTRAHDDVTYGGSGGGSTASAERLFVMLDPHHTLGEASVANNIASEDVPPGLSLPVAMEGTGGGYQTPKGPRADALSGSSTPGFEAVIAIASLAAAVVMVTAQRRAGRGRA